VHVERLDHLVLTVDDIDRTVAFYVGVLGMTETKFRSDRTALTFGMSKINLHQRGREYEPKALHPTPGSADVCLIMKEPLSVVEAELTAAGVAIEEGPVERTGAQGPLLSLYVRDPDANLVELSTGSPSPRPTATALPP
jgi:catechol 2,3-dioxygenase-like lactoylglutathione lyase family enzyme